MHILNEAFEKIYCINLINRPDRRKKMETRFNKLGIEVEFFTTVEYGFNHKLLLLLKNDKHDFVYPGEIGCAISHYTLLKKAKEDNLHNIFIFEDDTVFHNNFNELLPNYLAVLPTNWDMFYLYIMQYSFNDYHYENDFIMDDQESKLILFRPRNAHCASAYGVNQNGISYILHSMDTDFRIIDSRYRLMQNGKFNIWSCFPNLCGQDFDRSNIRGNGSTTPKLDYFNNVITFGNETSNNYF